MRASGVSRAYLDDEHPITLMAMSNLASGYVRQGRMQKAEVLQRQTLEIRRRVRGDENPRTVRAMINLAGSLCALKETEEGHKLLREAAAIAPKLFPPEYYYHDVIAGQQGACLGHDEEFERAEPLLLAAYEDLWDKLCAWHGGSMDELFALIRLYEGWGMAAREAYYRATLEEIQEHGEGFPESK